MVNSYIFQTPNTNDDSDSVSFDIREVERIAWVKRAGHGSRSCVVYFKSGNYFQFDGWTKEQYQILTRDWYKIGKITNQLLGKMLQ